MHDSHIDRNDSSVTDSTKSDSGDTFCADPESSP